MMTAWASDPVVRSGLRNRLGLLWLVPVVTSATSLWTSQSTQWAWQTAMYCLCVAAPAAAAYYVDIERNGRLDLWRLAGRPPMGLLAIVLATVAGPWVVAGLALLGWAAATGHPTGPPGPAVAFLTISVAVAAASTRVRFAEGYIDPRVGIGALMVVGISIAVLAGGRVSSRFELVDTWVIGLALAATAWGLYGVRARVAYPPVLEAVLMAWRVRLPRWLLRFPGIYRGSQVAISGAVLGFIFLPMVVIMRLLGGPQAPTDLDPTPVYALPLAIALVIISLICREDANAQRMDMLRLASRAAWRTALEFVVGLWLPFIVASAMVAVGVAVAYFLTASGAIIVAMLLAIAAPLPVIEGWSRMWPLTYVYPYVLVVLISRPILSSPVLLGVVVLNWWAVTRRFVDAERPVLPAPAAAGVLALLPAAAIGFSSNFGPEALFSGIVILLAIAPLFLDRHTVHSRRWPVEIMLIAASMTAAAWLRYGWPPAIVTGLTGAVIWFAAGRTVRLFPDAVPLQAAVRLGAVVATAILSELEPWRPWIGTNMTTTFMVDVLVLLGLVEVLARAIRLAGGRASRALTLPA